MIAGIYYKNQVQRLFVLVECKVRAWQIKAILCHVYLFIFNSIKNLLKICWSYYYHIWLSLSYSSPVISLLTSLSLSSSISLCLSLYLSVSLCHQLSPFLRNRSVTQYLFYHSFLAYYSFIFPLIVSPFLFCC